MVFGATEANIHPSFERYVFQQDIHFFVRSAAMSGFDYN